LTINQHVAVQKLKKVLQTVEKLRLSEFFAMNPGNIKNDDRSVFCVPTIKIKKAFSQNWFSLAPELLKILVPELFFVQVMGYDFLHGLFVVVSRGLEELINIRLGPLLA
jgi:hypothetical protein